MEEEITLLSDKELADFFVGDAYSLYMKEVFSYRLLSAEENKELARRYRNGDEKALEQLVNHNLRLVVNAAYKYKDRLNSMQLLDIIQEGNMGLMRAARDYDPEVAAFSTYANWWIKQAISRGISDKDNEIRKPIHIQTLCNKYLKLISKNKNISDEEICKELEIGKETLENIRHTLSLSSVSMNQTIDDDEKSELGDFLSTSNSDYDDILEEMSKKRLFVALREVLSDLEYYILYKRILADDRLTLEQLANEFGLSRERIRQIETRVLKKVKPLMENERKMQLVLKKIQEREKIKLDKYRIEPLEPIRIIKYLYVKDKLSFNERRLLYYIFFSEVNYTHKELAAMFKMSVDEFNEFYNNLVRLTSSYFKNNIKFDSYKDSMRKNYGTKIFAIDLSQDIKIIDYEALREKYSNLDLDSFVELASQVDYTLTKDEILLLTNFYHIPLRKMYSTDALLRDLNLTVFGYKGKSIEVPKNKLWDVYCRIINDFTDEQKLFLECYVFNKRNKAEFKTKYKGSSLYYRYYYLIDRLERVYFNIYRYFDNNFTRSDYLSFREKYIDKFSKERIELLDLYYGYSKEPLTILEIAKMYDMDYIKLHDKISDAREAAILMYSGFTQKLDIDKTLYIPYIMDSAYYFTDETRAVLKLFFIEDKDYGEISKVMGLSKYRISNIITDSIRKMDNFRFGISEVFRISEVELENFFNKHENMFSLEERNVLRLKFLKYMENPDIAQHIGISSLDVNKYVSHFNRIYYSDSISQVTITVDDIEREVNKHISESVLTEIKKEMISFYYGLKNRFNPEGMKLSKEDIRTKYNLTKNAWNHQYSNIISDVKGRKIGVKKVPNCYISRDELYRLLDDYHLPISDKEREIICYLFELKGFPYKSFEELSLVYGDTKGSIVRRYQRAIISIYKYLNNEIEGKISYEIDILPLLKYFSYSDRNIINMYYRDGYSCEYIAKKYNISFDRMFTIIEKIKINLVDMLNNPKAKKFDFDYYMKVRNEVDLPFYGDREKAIVIFDLFYGMSDGLRLGIPEIKRKLELEAELSSINRAANNLMLAVCKYQIGIKTSHTFTPQEIKEYYELHKDEMPSYKKQYYLRYFKKLDNSKRLNGITPGVSYVILYDLLKSNNPNIYTFDNLDRDTIIKLIRKYNKDMSNYLKRELMAIYEISPREFMNGKDINHVYKIFYTLDEKLKEKGYEGPIKKKD